MLLLLLLLLLLLRRSVSVNFVVFDILTLSGVDVGDGIGVVGGVGGDGFGRDAVKRRFSETSGAAAFDGRVAASAAG